MLGGGEQNNTAAHSLKECRQLIMLDGAYELI